jgi:hypothetical protein
MQHPTWLCRIMAICLPRYTWRGLMKWVMREFSVFCTIQNNKHESSKGATGWFYNSKMQGLQQKMKKCLQQPMWPLSNHEQAQGPYSRQLAINLFGPTEYQQTTNKRQREKESCSCAPQVWPCMWNLLAPTRLIDFSWHWWRFFCLWGRGRGTSLQIQSDMDSCNVQAWDFMEGWEKRCIMAPCTDRGEGLQ